MRVLCGCALIAVTASARAAHPFLTDDTGTQGKGNWQLELLVERASASARADLGAGPVSQDSNESLFTPALTYGLRDNLDIALGGAYLHRHVTQDGAPADEASGPVDSSIELKWRFHESNGLSFALKPGLSLPTGNEDKGLGSGKASWGASLIVTYQAGDWTLVANAAYQRARYALVADPEASRTDLWRVSAGFAHALTERLRLLGEAGVRTNPARDDPFASPANGQFAMLGLLYSRTEKMDFDLALRKGLNGAEPDDVVLAGATLRW